MRSTTHHKHWQCYLKWLHFTGVRKDFVYTNMEIAILTLETLEP